MGVLIGGFLSGLVSGRLTWVTEKGPRITSGTRLAFALVGRRALRHRRPARARLHERRRPQRDGRALDGRLRDDDGHLRHRLRGRLLLPEALDLTWHPWSRTSSRTSSTSSPACSSGSPSATSSSRPASRRRAASPASSTATTSRSCASSSPPRSRRWRACSSSAAAGLLDLDFIYVNPTVPGAGHRGRRRSWASGFILGGYCPGTSVCAAAIGKKDAIVFVLGGFLGVLLYGEAYPAIAGFRERRSTRARSRSTTRSASRAAASPSS